MTTAVDTLERFDARLARLGVVLSPDGSPNEIEGVLNPAGTIARDGSLLLYPRAVAAGNVSRVELCRGTREGDGDDVHFERLGFALEPSAPYELRTAAGGMGCEDPRVTFVPVLDRYLMAYTAFGPDGPRIAVAQSPDGYRWERVGLMTFAPNLTLAQGDDKDAVFFPEPVLSPTGVRSLAMYHRPMLRLSTQDGRGAVSTLLELPPEQRECTRIAYIPLDAVQRDSGALLRVEESALAIVPDLPWCCIKTGAGTPPVRIAEGWFSLFHGVDAEEVAPGRYAMRYSAGIVVHDAERPHIVRYRSAMPVMVPEGIDETHGIVNDVVFPTALCEVGDRTYEVYYGMADARVGRARIELAAPNAALEEPAA